jgi:exopolysaccharide production protein ExoZ
LNRLDDIQYMRAVAALLVVFSHLAKELKNNTQLFIDSINMTLLGQFGVDIFFVISGFIMFYVTRNSTGDWRESVSFLKKRFVRIVPLYWFFTIVTIILTVFFAEFKNNNDASLYYVIKSFLFIPAERLSDGNVTPVFGLGWTLNYEMFFYVLFAFILTLKRNDRILSTSLVFIGLVVLGYFMPKDPVYIWYWTRPIIAEFLLGAIICNIYLSGFRFSVYTSWAITSFGVILWVVLSYNFVPSVPHLRLYMWGIPAALIMTGIILSEKSLFSFVPRRVNLLLSLMGDSSFSLYLGHMFIIRAMTLFLGDYLVDIYTMVFYVIVTLTGCIVFSYFSYLYIEKTSLAVGNKILKVNRI